MKTRSLFRSQFQSFQWVVEPIIKSQLFIGALLVQNTDDKAALSIDFIIMF